ncbi:MAG: discoidin domain-containing protein, partial [Bacteroidia bacterium]|nr:discoidin domain-containing protein [Bacteroidia bacterium]
MGQLFWLANAFNRPDLNQFALENDALVAKGENPDYSGKINNLLWYNPQKFTTDQFGFTKLPLDKQFAGAQLAVMRSGWVDQDALFAGIKGTDDYRQANFYHRHTNTGTFYLSALGEQWAFDLGLEDYTIKEYNVQPRLYYKLRAEGHNCNVINPSSGIDNRGWEKCPIVRQGSTLQTSFAIVDMSPDYASLAKSAKRGLLMFDHRRKVLIQDEIRSLDGKPLDSYWFMQTEAGIDIATDGRSAMLYRGNEKMLVYMATAPKDARFTVMGTEPLVYTRPVGSKQYWTFGAKKLTIHTNSETNLKLAVVFVPIHQGEIVVPEYLPYQELDLWGVNTASEATVSDLRLDQKTIQAFDPRNFTYTIDLNDSKIPTIAAFSTNPASKVTVYQANTIPGMSKIMVSAEGMTASTYHVYFREKQVQIVGNAAKEYSSWDESFANHRIAAPKRTAGSYSDYDLGEESTVSAATIGFMYQNKAYPFELLASNDQQSWHSVYSGESTITEVSKVAMPQLFTFPAFKARYIRVKNPENASSFTIDILRFFKEESTARDYINNAYREILSDVKIYPTDLKLNVGQKLKLTLKGLSNYNRKVDLKDAKFSFESEKPEVASITATGEISAKEDGEARIRIIIQKGDIVLHKKIVVTVNNPSAEKIIASFTNYLNSKKPDINFSTDKIMAAGATITALLRFDTKQLVGKKIKKAVIRL